jgi:hypothetical protein
LLVVLALLGLAACAGPTPTVGPVVQPTGTIALRPTFTPEQADNPSPAAPTARPSATPSPTAQVQPSATPSARPTVQPTPKPTDTATPVAKGPSPTPTRKPTRTPTPLPPLPPQKGLTMNSPEYGVHVFLWWRPELAERDLLTAMAAGFTWVKQNFGWRDIEPQKGKFDWKHTDHIVYTANKYGPIDLLIRVDHPPEWAAPGCSDPGRGIVQGPPRNLKDYTDFLTALASRYKGRIRAYQVWNEPNLAREWCGRPPDPAAYARMLKAAYAAIKTADPNAMVISAGLSPTGTSDATALPDDVYLDRFYRAMGGKSDGYFDVLGVHGAGYKASPEMSPEEVAANKDYGGGRWFCFRRVEDLRRIMETYGDSHKQVAVLEFGWTSDTVHPDYAWHAVDEQTKADYIVRAYRWAREHWSPWIGVMSVIYIADPDWTPNDEQYWWAITNPDGTTRPAYQAIKNMPK